MAPNVGPAIRKSFLCQLSHYDWRPTWGLNWEILKFKFVIQFFHWFFFSLHDLTFWGRIVSSMRFQVVHYIDGRYSETVSSSETYSGHLWFPSVPHFLSALLPFGLEIQSSSRFLVFRFYQPISVRSDMSSAKRTIFFSIF